MTVDAFEQQLDYFSETHRLLARDEFLESFHAPNPD